MANSAFTVDGNTTVTGSIVQMKYVNGGGSSTTSSSYTDITGSEITITPTSNTNKILITMTAYMTVAVGGSNTYARLRCLRDGSPINGSPYALFGALAAVGGIQTEGTISFSYVDDPATTSAVTYKFQQLSQFLGALVTTANMTITAAEIIA